MKYRFTTVITAENDGFVSRALELGVVSQGKTVEEAETNLMEAVSLYLEKENITDLNKYDRSPIVTSLEIEYA
jgi:predicted RNase H-like HicB family nuclease